jgi:hypothetical protein
MFIGVSFSMFQTGTLLKEFLFGGAATQAQ